MALAYSSTVRNAMLDAITTAIGSNGLLRIYDGSRPASGGTVTTKLAELALSATAAARNLAEWFERATEAEGTATWFRVTTSGGTFVIDGSVGTSGSDLNLTTTSIVATQPVSVTSFVITEGNP